MTDERHSYDTEDRVENRTPGASRRDVLRLTGAGLATATTLGTIGSASAASTAGKTPWLHREGNEIRDPMDNRVILRGVNIADPKRLAHTVSARGKNWNHIIDHATDATRGWHANVIRIPVQPGDIAGLAPIPQVDVKYYEPVTFTEEQLIEYCETYLDPVVEFCRQQNVYCIVDYHRHWGKLKWHTDALDEELRLFWNTVAPRYADQPHVIYEMYNEPTLPGMYIDDWYTPKYAGIWRRWKKVAQPWVDIIREYAPDNLIVIGSPGWSSQPEGAEIEEFDGKNLMYTYHIYPGHGITTPEGFDGRTKEEGTSSVWKQVPLFMTEFGWEPGAGRWIGGTTSGFGEGVTQWADNRPIHWTAWCFDTAWLPSMFDRAFVDEQAADSVGNPYSGDVPELCADPPCEWALLGRDAGTSEYMGEYIRTLLADRKDDDVPRVDHDPAPPPAPSSVTVEEVTTDSATLSWSAVTDAGSGLDHYVVSVEGQDWLETTATAATVENLIAGQSQEIGVRAVDRTGNAGPTTTVSVTTDGGTTGPSPTPPTGLTLADRTHRSVTLSWSAPDGVDVARYVVTVDGEQTARLRSSTATYRIDGMSLDGAVSVGVTTVDRWGRRSEPATATVRPQPAHATESDLLINDFEGAEPLTNNALGMWVGGGLIDEVSTGIAIADWNGITYHGTTVDADATSTPLLKIKARGEAGYELSMLALSVENGDSDVPVGDVTDDRIVPDEWRVVTIDLRNLNADLASPGQLQFDTVWGTAGHFEIDALWLAAPDDPGKGIGQDGAPSAPTDVSATSVTASSIDLEWTPVAAATEYEVTIDGEGALTTTEASTTLSGLAGDTAYEIGVVAINDAGRSAPATATIRTAGGGPPAIDGTTPTDPDGDGLYEDFSGDGAINFPDVNTFFQNSDTETVQSNVQYFDFESDDRITLQDVMALFRMV